MTSRHALPGLMMVLATVTVPVACGNVTALSANTDGGPDASHGTSRSGEGGGGGKGASAGAGGLGIVGAGGSPAIDAGAANGLLGKYFTSDQGGTAYMTRVDATIDFSGGPSGLEPAEVTWTGEIDLDGTASIEFSANPSDQLSMSITNQVYATGGAIGMGQITGTISTLVRGWAMISVDIKRTDLTSSFKAVLSRQLSSDGSTIPFIVVPTDVLKPD